MVQSEMSSVEKLVCPYETICSGCQLRHLTAPLQLAAKKDRLSCSLVSLQLSPEIEIIQPSPFFYRDRLDFVLSDGKMGLYARGCEDILDLVSCLQLSPELQAFYTDFRKIQFPIKKGSFRLRISPSGIRGAWLDFSNLDVKFLLEEKTALKQLLQICHVEIGQRSKVLIQHPEKGLKLVDPIKKVWFQTFHQKKAIPLKSTLKSFTQSGHKSNQVIIEVLQSMLKGKSYKQAAEFGCGIGNLSLPVLEFAEKLDAFDWDKGALESFAETLKDHPDLAAQIHLNGGDFRIRPLDAGRSYDLLILNPARSGLGKFLDHLATIQPWEIFYMSCFLESFIEDAKKLKASGYELSQVKIVDQFAQTEHFEILTLWKRSGGVIAQG